MKKIIAFLLVVTLSIGLTSAYAFGFDDLGSLFGVFDSGSKSTTDSKTETKTDDSLPSLIGPFSGKIVSVTVNKKTYKVHQEFKDALTAYEEFFDSYIDVMTNINSPDYLTKYAKFMTQYAETNAELEKLDKLSDKEKDWSKDEANYYTQVLLNVNQKMYDALGTM